MKKFTHIKNFIPIAVAVLVLTVGYTAFASINNSSNFLLSAQKPLDARTVVADIATRDAIPSIQRYEGLTVYVLADRQTYQLQANATYPTGITNNNWVIFGDNLPNGSVHKTLQWDPTGGVSGTGAWIATDTIANDVNDVAINALNSFSSFATLNFFSGPTTIGNAAGTHADLTVNGNGLVTDTFTAGTQTGTGPIAKFLGAGDVTIKPSQDSGNVSVGVGTNLGIPLNVYGNVNAIVPPTPTNTTGATYTAGVVYPCAPYDLGVDVPIASGPNAFDTAIGGYLDSQWSPTGAEFATQCSTGTYGDNLTDLVNSTGTSLVPSRILNTTNTYNNTCPLSALQSTQSSHLKDDDCTAGSYEAISTSAPDKVYELYFAQPVTAVQTLIPAGSSPAHFHVVVTYYPQAREYTKLLTQVANSQGNFIGRGGKLSSLDATSPLAPAGPQRLTCSDVSGWLVPCTNQSVLPPGGFDGQALVWDAGTSTWIPSTTSGLVDNGTADQTTRWDGTLAKWVPSSAITNSEADVQINATNSFSSWSPTNFFQHDVNVGHHNTGTGDLIPEFVADTVVNGNVYANGQSNVSGSTGQTYVAEAPLTCQALTYNFSKVSFANAQSQTYLNGLIAGQINNGDFARACASYTDVSNGSSLDSHKILTSSVAPSCTAVTLANSLTAPKLYNNDCPATSYTAASGGPSEVYETYVPVQALISFTYSLSGSGLPFGPFQSSWPSSSNIDVRIKFNPILNPYKITGSSGGSGIGTGNFIGSATQLGTLAGSVEQTTCSDTSGWLIPCSNQSNLPQNGVDGQVLTWNAGTATWQDLPPQITNAGGTDGQTTRWNNTSQKWEASSVLMNNHVTTALSSISIANQDASNTNAPVAFSSDASTNFFSHDVNVGTTGFNAQLNVTGKGLVTDTFTAGTNTGTNLVAEFLGAGDVNIKPTANAGAVTVGLNTNLGVPLNVYGNVNAISPPSIATASGFIYENPVTLPCNSFTVTVADSNMGNLAYLLTTYGSQTPAQFIAKCVASSNNVALASFHTGSNMTNLMGSSITQGSSACVLSPASAITSPNLILNNCSNGQYEATAGAPVKGFEPWTSVSVGTVSTGPGPAYLPTAAVTFTPKVNVFTKDPTQVAGAQGNFIGNGAKLANLDGTHGNEVQSEYQLCSDPSGWLIQCLDQKTLPNGTVGGGVLIWDNSYNTWVATMDPFVPVEAGAIANQTTRWNPTGGSNGTGSWEASSAISNTGTDVFVGWNPADTGQTTTSVNNFFSTANTNFFVHDVNVGFFGDANLNVTKDIHSGGDITATHDISATHNLNATNQTNTNTLWVGDFATINHYLSILGTPVSTGLQLHGGSPTAGQLLTTDASGNISFANNIVAPGTSTTTANQTLTWDNGLGQWVVSTMGGAIPNGTNHGDTAWWNQWASIPHWEVDQTIQNNGTGVTLGNANNNVYVNPVIGVNGAYPYSPEPWAGANAANGVSYPAKLMINAEGTSNTDPAANLTSADPNHPLGIGNDWVVHPLAIYGTHQALFGGVDSYEHTAYFQAIDPGRRANELLFNPQGGDVSVGSFYDDYGRTVTGHLCAWSSTGMGGGTSSCAYSSERYASILHSFKFKVQGTTFLNGDTLVHGNITGNSLDILSGGHANLKVNTTIGQDTVSGNKLLTLFGKLKVKVKSGTIAEFLGDGDFYIKSGADTGKVTIGSGSNVGVPLYVTGNVYADEPAYPPSPSGYNYVHQNVTYVCNDGTSTGLHPGAYHYTVNIPGGTTIGSVQAIAAGGMSFSQFVNCGTGSSAAMSAISNSANLITSATTIGVCAAGTQNLAVNDCPNNAYSAASSGPTKVYELSILGNYSLDYVGGNGTDATGIYFYPTIKEYVKVPSSQNDSTGLFVGTNVELDYIKHSSSTPNASATVCATTQGHLILCADAGPWVRGAGTSVFRICVAGDTNPACNLHIASTATIPIKMEIWSGGGGGGFGGHYNSNPEESGAGGGGGGGGGYATTTVSLGVGNYTVNIGGGGGPGGNGGSSNVPGHISTISGGSPGGNASGSSPGGGGFPGSGGAGMGLSGAYGDTCVGGGGGSSTGNGGHGGHGGYTNYFSTYGWGTNCTAQGNDGEWNDGITGGGDGRAIFSW